MKTASIKQVVVIALLCLCTTPSFSFTSLRFGDANSLGQKFHVLEADKKLTSANLTVTGYEHQLTNATYNIQPACPNRSFSFMNNETISTGSYQKNVASDTAIKPTQYLLKVGYIMAGFGFGGSGFYSKDIEGWFSPRPASIVNGAFNLSIGLRAGIKNIIEYEYLRSVDLTHKIKVDGEEIDFWLYEIEHLLKINPTFTNKSEFYPNIIMGLGNFKYLDTEDDGWKGTSYILGMEYFALMEESWYYGGMVFGLKFYKINIKKDITYGVVTPVKYNGFQFTIDFKMYFGFGI
jgi:hypothetical protein